MSDWPQMADDVRAAAALRGVVIIGGGQAGGRAAESLRREGFAGAVTLVGAEAWLPYERPSLSKDMLIHSEVEKIEWVQTENFYRDHAVTLHLGDAVRQIDHAARRVELESGTWLDYGVLVLATGARVRRLDLPGAEGHVHYVRTLEDSRELSARLKPASRIAIIGAGFIGLEVAAAAIARGAAVTVFETGPAPLGRVVPGIVGEAYRALHEARGVIFHFGVRPVAVHQMQDHLAVEIEGGELVAADTIVVGIGVIPNAELAVEAGLETERGVLTDEFAATSDPHIFAIGDVAQHVAPLLGRRVLLESWQNAQNQAMSLARNLVIGRPPQAHAELPWFWSDQYEFNLQMFGLHVPGGEIISRGTPGASGWTVLQLLGGTLTCAIGLNASREVRAARELMNLRVRLDAASLADAATPLMSILRREKAALAAL
jgi:NADPH-dependent 2,4-dienoyl-CoA reductase/sulfur reductase-like enzyme